MTRLMLALQQTLTTFMASDGAKEVGLCGNCANLPAEPMLCMQCLLNPRHDVNQNSKLSKHWSVLKHACMVWSMSRQPAQAHQPGTYKLQRRVVAPVNDANSTVTCQYQQLPICTPAACANLALDRRGRVESGGKPLPAGCLSIVNVVHEVNCLASRGSQCEVAVGRA